MASIGAAVESVPVGHTLYNMCVSGLARHIGTFGSMKHPVTVDHERLYMAGFRMTGLRTLNYKFPQVFDGDIRFPPSLTHLHITGISGDPYVNPAILGASRLPNLVTLDIDWGSNTLINFAPLHHMKQLQTLIFVYSPGEPELTQQQADDLRTIPNLTHLELGLYVADLRLLFGEPCQLQLQLQVLKVSGDLDEAQELLKSLPSLHHLMNRQGESLTFLRSLSCLRTLDLAYCSFLEPEQMIHGIGQCDQLTTFSIFECEITSTQLGALLSRMPSIRNLTIEYSADLESLSFLSAAPTLASFTFEGSGSDPFPASELYHVFSLQQLTSLELHRDCFSEPLDSLTLRELTPPSRQLPKLIKSAIS